MEDATFDNMIARLRAESEGKLDTDLGGMDSAGATEYVLAFATTWKETQQARELCEKDVALWRERVRLAKAKNEEALALQAQSKVDELVAKLSSLQQEEKELGRKVAFMKDELARIKAKPELSLDPEALLAQLESVAGKPDTTLKDIKKEEAAMELERLKQKMRDDGQG